MRKDREFLSLFFNEGESFCVSPNKYGYHSISQEQFLSGKTTLISPNSKVRDMEYTIEDMNLMALNPIKGFREDSNCTSLRSFLVEVDTGSLLEQRDYIAQTGMPYSCCVFSGNKSLHYGIVLSEDLLNLQEYYFYIRWILNVVSKADQMTLNPSRSIRYPFNKRKDGKQLIQSLIDIKGRISKADLIAWLSNFPDKRPEIRTKELTQKTPADPRKIPISILNRFKKGIDFSKGRNVAWFKLAIQLAKAGYELEDIEEILGNYYEEESDFTRKEWLACINSAYKKAQKDG